MFGQLYHLSGAAAKRRARALLERFDLVDVASRLVRTYSGGMRRRLDPAASLIVSPPILFLDEPTTGLKTQIGGERLELTVAPGGDLQAALQALRPHSSGEMQSDNVHRHLTVPVERGAQQLEAIVRDLDAAGGPLNDLTLRRPTLDDVFLSLTGRATTEAPHPEVAAVPQSLERSSR